MKNFTTLAAAGLVALVATAAAVGATTIVVNPANEDSWAAQSSNCNDATPTGSQSFVNGPATPPLGTGSRQFQTGSDGASEEDYRNTAYSGTPLSSLTKLGYSTYVQSVGTGQDVYIILDVDQDANGTVDDFLFFEPAYQTAVFFPSNPQPAVASGMWQTWDARHGGWWSINGDAGATPGTGVKSLDTYSAAFPNAVIRNGSTGRGGVRLVVGCGASEWANFVGNADGFTIGVSGTDTTYNFEAAPSSKDDCKNGGWAKFTVPRKFKNQGDCIQYVNTGK